MSWKCVLTVMGWLLFFAVPAIASAADDADDADPIAWGTPRDGLQAGLRLVRGDVNGDSQEIVGVAGVPLKFEVLVRNVSAEPILIKYPQPAGFAYSDGPVVRATPHQLAPEVQVVSVSLEPLKLHRIGDIYIGYRRPKVNALVDPRPFWPSSGEGLRHIGAINVLSKPSDEGPPLNTGFIDVMLRRSLR